MASPMDIMQAQMLVEQMERLANAMERVNETQSRTVKGATTEASKSVKDMFEGMEGDMDQLLDVAGSRWEQWRGKLTLDWNQTVESMKSTMSGLKAGAGDAFDAKHIKSGLQSFKRSLLSEVPFGGILGIMLYGRMKEAEFAAFGEQAAQQFKTAGRVGRQEAGQLGGVIRRLQTSFQGTAQDVMTVTAAMADAGVQADQGFGKAEFAIEGSRRTLIETSVALDKMFQQGSGATAKTTVQLMRDTNVTLREGLTLTKDLGFAARESGMSFQQMSATITQATSALRLQQVDARALADTVMQMQRGFEAQGMGRERAGALAAGGMGALAQSLTGMGQGQQAVIGQRVAGTLGMGDVGGIEAIIQMQRGFRGQEGSQTFFAEALNQMTQMAEEIAGPNEFQQEFTMQRMFGMTPEASQALMAMRKDISAGMTVDKAAAKHADELNKAFRDEALKTSTFTKLMTALRDTIARLGSELLNQLIISTRVLKTGFEFIFNWATSDISDDYADAAKGQLLMLGQMQDKSLARMLGALDPAKNRSAEVLKQLLGPAGLTRGPMEQFRARGGQVSETGASLPERIGKKSAEMTRELTRRIEVDAPWIMDVLDFDFSVKVKPSARPHIEPKL